MNIETAFFKATDGADLKGVIYKTQNKTNLNYWSYIKSNFKQKLDSFIQYNS